MDLVSAFQEYISKEGLFSPRDRLLLAVSGGLDSVVLCDLCKRSGYDFVIAHCNFGLRGAESQRDEAFVRELGGRYGCEVVVRHFDTAAYVVERKVSVQVAARELRYAWFGELVAGGVAQHVVTAHQLDDNIETLLMNFFKGTGIAGLRAMLPKQGLVVRPLLFASREAIRQYASECGLAWVEDS
ncbi:MAG TPA: tRNA lysidine(34) synthetase TilS, partial [Puia sp.]|nr:tRNA lysidine(34) synthetase TilS [Puia sp.]